MKPSYLLACTWIVSGLPSDPSCSASEIIWSQVVGGFGTRSLRYHSSCVLVLKGDPYSLPLKDAVLMTLGKTCAVTCLRSESGNCLIHPAFANSAVHVTSMPIRSTVESFAARRRTSCSRCWLASVGSSWTSTSYLPCDSALQRFATFWIVPPGCVATNQFSFTGPALPDPPHIL